MHEKIHGLSSRARVDRKWRLLARASRRISNWTWHGVGYNSNRSLKQLFLIECPDQAGIVVVLLCFKMNCFRQSWKSFHQLTDAFFSVSSKTSFARATVRTDGVHTLGVDVTHRNCWITFVHVWKKRNSLRSVYKPKRGGSLNYCSFMDSSDQLLPVKTKIYFIQPL